jgi:hypothetical protein
MKILLIHNYYRKKNIGGEDIVFDAEVGALKKRLGDSNVFVYTVSSDDTTGWRLLFSIWFSLSQYRAVYALVKKHNIDIVHVHNFFPSAHAKRVRRCKKRWCGSGAHSAQLSTVVYIGNTLQCCRRGP